MSDVDFPFQISNDEIIMRANTEIISSLAGGLINVETGKDSQVIIKLIEEHSRLVLDFSEKLIKSKRMDIRSVS
tara:strand:- start:708 stop:929 length:222 start_codon:yes stop_codon:yes gene_type:complete